MSIIQRYVLKELLTTFLLVLVIIIGMLSLAGGIREGIRRGLPPALAVQSIPYLLPEGLRFALPGALLFATCTVFGRMAAANEILALQTSGISLWRIVWPALVLAYLLSIGTYLLYDACAVWARPGLRELVVRSFPELVQSWIQHNGSFQCDQLSLSGEDVVDGQIVQPLLIVRQAGPRRDITVQAARLKITADLQQKQLEVKCQDAHVSIDGLGELRVPGVYRYWLEIPGSQEPVADQLGPAYLATWQLGPQIQRAAGQVRRLAKSRDSVQQQQDLQHWQERLYRLKAETPRRLANGFSCLAFVVLGIPVAVRLRTSDFFTTFLICFAPILLGFYPLLVVGETLARQGVWPTLSIWMANLVLAGFGLLLLRNCIRR